MFQSLHCWQIVVVVTLSNISALICKNTVLAEWIISTPSTTFNIGLKILQNNTYTIKYFCVNTFIVSVYGWGVPQKQTKKQN